MTRTLTMLFASTALTAALGLPAWSAIHAPAQQEAAAPVALAMDAGDDAPRLILVDDDEDDDDDEGEDDRDDDDDDDDDCDDDEGSCGNRAAPPAPAGSAAPPQNGLFGTGTPQVQVK